MRVHLSSHLLDHAATMSKYRRSLYFNDEWTSWSSPPIPSTEQVPKFHRSLPGYEQTPLRNLDDLAQEIEVRAVYLKDEGNRLGLPSFKILGASWGTFRAIASRLDLPLDLDLEAFKHALKDSNISLYAATDGNHGRAVARMGHWLGLKVEIHVPAAMNASTIQFIESEGAMVVRSTGTYDDAVLEAQTASERQGGILIQDFAFGDYEDVPQVSI
jgi:diaminopropionate ammonia-lyase family